MNLEKKFLKACTQIPDELITDSLKLKPHMKIIELNSAYSQKSSFDLENPKIAILEETKEATESEFSSFELSDSEIKQAKANSHKF